MKKFDAIVIGAGQAGGPLAKKLAKAGLRTAIIEKRYAGGTCVNDGCTPTKSMIACAKIAHEVAHSKEWGVYVSGGYQVKLKEIVNRKNEIVESFREGSRNGAKGVKKLVWMDGTASFTGKKTVVVKMANGQTETIRGERIFINAGCRPYIPPVEGLRAVEYLTSTTILDVEKLPQRLLVLGGSYIALEMAQLFHRLGSEVTVLEEGPRLLTREDADIAENVQSILRAEGIRFHTDISFHAITQKPNKVIQLNARKGDKAFSVSGSHILVAAGRIPNSDWLDVKKAKIETDARGFIKVNEYLETSTPGIYALGDIKGGPAFTHISYNDHLIVAKNLLENQQLSIRDRPVPYCMFTDPQLGRIGLSEEQARRQGYDIQVATLPMSSVARGIETGHTQGMMKAVVEKNTRKILGAAILGENGGEVMSVLQLAISAGMTYDVIRDTAFAHPTYTESLNNLFMKL